MASKYLNAAALAAVLHAFVTPALADWNCGASRCAGVRIIAEPKPHRAYPHRKHALSCEAPPGWGWYRRQKFCEDNRAPLAVFDELAITPEW